MHRSAKSSPRPWTKSAKKVLLPLRTASRSKTSSTLSKVCSLTAVTFRRTSSTTRIVRFPCWKIRSEEHTSELQSRENLVCRLLLEKKKHKISKMEIYKF